MPQNRSNAVMATRVEPNDSLDFFPTPLWATRALCETLKAFHQPLASQTAWDPAAGENHMARALAEYFTNVSASDVHDYGVHNKVRDFLWPGDDPEVDWIITNPPFRLGDQFALTAIAKARVGVGLLVRTAFLEGGERHARLFRDNPPTAIIQFCERVIMTKGIVRDPSVKYKDPATGLLKTPSTATAYCWLVWMKDDRLQRGGASFYWIEPCRKTLERPGDYQ